jgi:hypothetical protein
MWTWEGHPCAPLRVVVICARSAGPSKQEGLTSRVWGASRKEEMPQIPPPSWGQDSSLCWGTWLSDPQCFQKLHPWQSRVFPLEICLSTIVAVIRTQAAKAQVGEAGLSTNPAWSYLRTGIQKFDVTKQGWVCAEEQIQ